MAAVTLLGTQTVNTTSGTKTVTATPALGDLIVLLVAHTGNTASIAPTDNNSDGAGTYSLVNTCVKATSADTMQVWVRNAPIGSASSTVFTHAPGTSSGGGIGVFKVTGMSRYGLGSVRRSAIQSNQAGGGTPTPVLAAAALTTNPLIGAVFNATNAATMTPRSSPAYSERFDVGYSSPTTGLEAMSIDSGETGTSIAWGGTSASAFCSIVVELDASVPSSLIVIVRKFERVRRTVRRFLNAPFLADEPLAPSRDWSPDAGFVTRVSRSRRAQTAVWVAAMAPATVAPAAVPVAAWAAPAMLRRRNTTKRRPAVAAIRPLVIERYTPPPAAWEAPRRAPRLLYERKLLLAAPQVTFPLTTGPPQPLPAWIAPPLLRRRDNPRRFLEVRLEDYPASPPPPTSPDYSPAESFVTRVSASRRVRREPVVIVAAAAPPPQPLPAWLPPTVLRRRDNPRRVLEPRLDTFPATPAPPQPLPAWAAVPAIRRRDTARRLQDVRLDNYPATPPSQPPLPAWAAPPTFRRRDNPRRVLEARLEEHPATPAAPTSPDYSPAESFVTRVSASRKVRRAAPVIVAAVAPPPTSPAEPAAIFGSRKLPRRKHRQGLFLSGGAVVVADVQPQFPSWQRANDPPRIKTTKRRFLSARLVPYFPATPAGAPTLPAYQRPRAFVVTHARTLRTAPPPITTPALPQPLTAWQAKAPFRITRERALLAAPPPPFRRAAATDAGDFAGAAQLGASFDAVVTAAGVLTAGASFGATFTGRAEAVALFLAAVSAGDAPGAEATADAALLATVSAGAQLAAVAQAAAALAAAVAAGETWAAEATARGALSAGALLNAEFLDGGLGSAALSAGTLNAASFLGAAAALGLLQAGASASAAFAASAEVAGSVTAGASAGASFSSTNAEGGALSASAQLTAAFAAAVEAIATLQAGATIGSVYSGLASALGVIAAGVQMGATFRATSSADVVILGAVASVRSVLGMSSDVVNVLNVRATIE